LKRKIASSSVVTFLSAVAVRIRPLQTDSENPQKGNGKKSKAGWTLEKSGATDTLIQKGTARKVEGRTIFHFDSVFDEETQTPLLYKSIARPMVKTVVCKYTCSWRNCLMVALLSTVHSSQLFFYQMANTPHCLPMDKPQVVKHLLCKGMEREAAVKRGSYSWLLQIYFVS
jgi:hypothetical protein